MKKNKLYLLILFACFIGYSWLFFVKLYSNKFSNTDYTTCIFKRITTIPCASCGTTRAVIQLFNGELLASLNLNPFGILVGAIMVISPIWITFDFFGKRQTFYNFYIKTERLIRTRKISILLILLVLFNWIWNIYKHL